VRVRDLVQQSLGDASVRPIKDHYDGQHVGFVVFLSFNEVCHQLLDDGWTVASEYPFHNFVATFTKDAEGQRAVIHASLRSLLTVHIRKHQKLTRSFTK